MTLLELVNKVLRRLREDEVTDLVSSSYARLIAEFVSDAHREVVEAHDWSSMDKEVVIALSHSPGRTVYSLAPGSLDLYSGYTGVTTKAQLRYLDDVPLAYLYEDPADVDTGEPLSRLAQGKDMSVRASVYEREGLTGQPCAFSLYEADDGLALQLDSVPDKAYWLLLVLHDPEAEIDVDTDANRALLAPSAPVYARALYYAQNERGEEMGESGTVAEARAVAAISAAIETDRIRSARANTYEMYRD